MKNVELPEKPTAVLGAMLPILKKVPNQSSHQEREKAAADSSEAERVKVDEAETDPLDGVGGAERKQWRKRKTFTKAKLRLSA